MEDNDISKILLTSEEVSRYSRHISLPEIGIHGQKLLKSSSVLCIGTGGLGSPILLYLAGAGIGKIGIVDYDVVEDSNLHRQVIHSTKWIQKPKVHSAKSRILEINPYCHVETFNKRLTKDNALQIINEYDLVCDCTDNFPSRYLINDACVILNKPNIYGSISGFEGQATVFNLEENSPNYRDLVAEPPPPGLIPSCEEGGVIGILPGIIGLIQATEAIKIITKVGNTLSGRLLVFNALTMRFKELTLEADINGKKITTLIDYNKFCRGEKDSAESKEKVKSISTRDLKKILNTNSDSKIILDVRNYHEHKKDSIDGSIVIPLQKIENEDEIKKIQRLSKDKSLYVYCKSGGRSTKAILILEKYGIKGINVQGGIDSFRLDID